ncbi:hypothetical protein [Nakamurella leprariae]|uniref:Small secreted protein n=1 Tax=Nakamurella leprariae TaxID=2803911 RepID=A0A938Y9K7_9ACTN|nr:hypothetical protein [Nakamurella leprariae]MBM9465694.1 hypothetical protein [Nakamurella leprariae]
MKLRLRIASVCVVVLCVSCSGRTAEQSVDEACDLAGTGMVQIAGLMEAGHVLLASGDADAADYGRELGIQAEATGDQLTNDSVGDAYSPVKEALDRVANTLTEAGSSQALADQAAAADVAAGALLELCDESTT